ncbi:MAG: sel1 repeat family protein [Porticoccaceae bacterium]|nr:sel1 repeat family protein [Porticoccaceae bacterium]
MKILQLLQQLFTGFFLIIISISILTWMGVFNPFEKIESAMSGDVENKLTAEASSGNADAQNKLGTLLYVQAKKQKGGFTEAIHWFEQASEQEHPIAQLNLAFAYKAGNGVPADPSKAISLLYKSGVNFIKMGYPMDARDNVHSMVAINPNHPLNEALMKALKADDKKNK